jgi:cell division protein FtsB
MGAQVRRNGVKIQGLTGVVADLQTELAGRSRVNAQDKEINTQDKEVVALKIKGLATEKDVADLRRANSKLSRRVDAQDNEINALKTQALAGKAREKQVCARAARRKRRARASRPFA